VKSTRPTRGSDGDRDHPPQVQLADLGAREVRKLQAELAEITEFAAEILHEHQGAVRKPRPAPQWRGVMAAPAW
jgi:hypothetical protein